MRACLGAPLKLTCCLRRLDGLCVHICVALAAAELNHLASQEEDSTVAPTVDAAEHGVVLRRESTARGEQRACQQRRGEVGKCQMGHHEDATSTDVGRGGGSTVAYEAQAAAHLDVQRARVAACADGLVEGKRRLFYRD